MSGAWKRLVLAAVVMLVAGSTALAFALGEASAAKRPSRPAASSVRPASRAVAGRSARHASNCPRPTIPVPPNEPVYRTGPTELVSGLYIQGGAIPPPPCKPKPRGPYAGTITVSDAGTGNVVVTKSVRNGHLAHIPLPPGSYKVSGQIKGGGNTSFQPTVTIKQGYKTRQDLFEDVP